MLLSIFLSYKPGLSLFLFLFFQPFLCAPKCEKTVQALLYRNLNVKSATLLNATSSRRIHLQDDIVTGFHFSVSERFVSGSTFKASTVEQIREAFVPMQRFHIQSHIMIIGREGYA